MLKGSFQFNIPFPQQNINLSRQMSLHHLQSKVALLDMLMEVLSDSLIIQCKTLPSNAHAIQVLKVQDTCAMKQAISRAIVHQVYMFHPRQAASILLALINPTLILELAQVSQEIVIIITHQHSVSEVSNLRFRIL